MVVISVLGHTMSIDTGNQFVTFPVCRLLLRLLSAISRPLYRRSTTVGVVATDMHVFGVGVAVPGVEISRNNLLIRITFHRWGLCCEPGNEYKICVSRVDLKLLLSRARGGTDREPFDGKNIYIKKPEGRGNYPKVGGSNFKVTGNSIYLTTNAGSITRR